MLIVTICSPTRIFQALENTETGIYLAQIWLKVSALFTARKRSLGQGNIFRSVCQEFCPYGGLPQCMLGYHPTPPTRQAPSRTRQAPPWDQAGNPQTRHPPGPGTSPPDQSMLGDTVNERAVHIPLECILVMDEIAVFITKNNFNVLIF